MTATPRTESIHGATLDRLEWAPMPGNIWWCRVCIRTRAIGHAEGCAFVALRAAVEGRGEPARDVAEVEATLPLMCSYCSFELQPPQDVATLHHHIESECEYHPIRRYKAKLERAGERERALATVLASALAALDGMLWMHGNACSECDEADAVKRHIVALLAADVGGKS